MTTKLFNKLYKLLSVIAVMCIINPIVYLLFYHIVPGGGAIWIYLIGGALVAVGYGMQAFYGTITAPRHNARSSYYADDGYEAAENPFQPLRAALPITASAVLALVSYGVINGILYALYKAGIIMAYNSQSLFPFLGAALVFAYLFVGVVLWFFPAHRIISLRMMFTYFGIMGVVFIASLALSVPTALLSISLIIFFSCAFVVLNQTYIQRGVTGTVTAISGEGRIYNIKLMAVVIAVAIFIVLLFTIILTGIGFVCKFIFMYIMVMLFRTPTPDGDRYYDVGEAEADFSEVLLKNQPTGDKIMIVLCILLFIGAIVFFIFRGHAATKRMIDMIKVWLQELYMFFMNMKNFGGFSNGVEYEYMNYHDEEINLQDAMIRQYNPKVAERRSYREFLAYLNSLDTATDQIRYAYITMISVFRSLGYGIRAAETPRETEARIRARSTESGMTEARQAIEAVDYIEQEPTEAECETAIRSMCRVIEKHFTS